MIIVTAAMVSDGDPVVWIAGVCDRYEEVEELIELDKKHYEEDYEESADDAGVAYETHEVKK